MKYLENMYLQDFIMIALRPEDGIQVRIKKRDFLGSSEWPNKNRAK